MSSALEVPGLSTTEFLERTNRKNDSRVEALSYFPFNEIGATIPI